jgi:RimJ/RimL family protein N-acetyltransferase
MATLPPEIFKLLKTNQKLSIRSLEVDDAMSSLAFRKHMSNETTHTMHYPGMSFPTLEEAQLKMKWTIESSSELLIGAFFENSLIATIGFHVPKETHPWYKHLGVFGMMVIQKYSGLGLGTKLMQLMELHAQKIGIKKIEASVRSNNTKALNLYKKFGYQIEGTRKCCAFINDEYLDEHYIAKFLT